MNNAQVNFNLAAVGCTVATVAMALAALGGALDTPGIPGDEIIARAACVVHGDADHWVAKGERIDVLCKDGVEVKGLKRVRDDSVSYLKEKK